MRAFPVYSEEPNTPYELTLDVWGLIVSLSGTFFLAISAFEYQGMSVRSSSGREFHELLLDPVLFKLSLWLIGVGFLLQITARVWTSIGKRCRKVIFYVLHYFSLLLMFYVSFYRIFGLF